jgi:hypothetical protein
VRVRTEGILTRPVAAELVVYDARTDKAHLLDPVSATVWRACASGRSLGEIAMEVGERFTAAAPEQVVWSALHELAAAGLVDGDPAIPEGAMTRRELLKRAGLAAVLLPAVTTILAPTPAAAQATGGPCRPNGNACTGNSQCCTQNCSAGTCQCQVTAGPCLFGADCCSGVCTSGTCQCRATGTACTAGNQCCDGVCSAGVCCRPAAAACITAGQCCSGICSGGVCTNCRVTGTACTTGTQCCSGICTGGVCVTCIANNVAGCTTGADCCSGICTTGTCRCRAQGVACATAANCCAGICTAGTCCTTSVETTSTCQQDAECCHPSGQAQCGNNRCCLSPDSTAHGGVASRCCSGQLKNGNTQCK